jgi:hypothetical protein
VRPVDEIDLAGSIESELLSFKIVLYKTSRRPRLEARQQ